MKFDERKRVWTDVFGAGDQDQKRSQQSVPAVGDGFLGAVQRAIAAEPMYNSMTRKTDFTGILADCIHSLK
ncbi:hypothetical protein [Scytonema sp. PRP1]|uniref:hypothetical protein n=1 Tax=Scytonema sp. PRP1 TaxID=3120513 RepID=UPI002FD3D1AF